MLLSSHILYEVQQVCNRVTILQKGQMLKQGEVRELLSVGERLMVRMDNSDQAESALKLLYQLQQDGASWIKRLYNAQDSAFRLDAPLARSSEITGLLAQKQLYLAEICPESANLEEVFLELIGPEERKGNMAALIN